MSQKNKGALSFVKTNKRKTVTESSIARSAIAVTVQKRLFYITQHYNLKRNLIIYTYTHERERE